MVAWGPDVRMKGFSPNRLKDSLTKVTGGSEDLLRLALA